MVKKETNKSIDDKTFGMKNKNKSQKVKKFVQSLQATQTAVQNQTSQAQLTQIKDQAAKLKEQKNLELKQLFQEAQVVQKCPFGVDPKTVICNAHKQGKCTKKNCKFSHDLRLGQKAPLYEEEGEDGKKDDMEDWTQEQLEEAVDKKQNKNRATEIVCKFFLEAIETKKYGWFWECSSGADCVYKHALPKGFILKKKESAEERKAREEENGKMTIESLIETKRAQLKSTIRVTEETFLKWKKERQERGQIITDDVNVKKKDALLKLKAGIRSGIKVSGKDMFDFNPQWASYGDDEDLVDLNSTTNIKAAGSSPQILEI